MPKFVSKSLLWDYPQSSSICIPVFPLFHLSKAHITSNKDHLHFFFFFEKSFSFLSLPSRLQTNKSRSFACRKKQRKEATIIMMIILLRKLILDAWEWHFIFACLTSPFGLFHVSVAIWFNYFLNHLWPHETASMIFLFILVTKLLSRDKPGNWKGKLNNFRSSDSSKSSLSIK